MPGFQQPLYLLKLPRAIYRAENKFDGLPVCQVTIAATDDFENETSPGKAILLALRSGHYNMAAGGVI